MIKFYTIECPRCIVLEKKMKNKGIEFEKITDFNKYDFVKNGYHTMPLLDIDGTIYTYEQAVKYINEKV